MIYSLCSDAVGDAVELHLRCSDCDQVLHYRCGMGYDDPVKAFKVSLGKQQQYKCPVCIVGSTYKLIHMALRIHEQRTQAALADRGEVHVSHTSAEPDRTHNDDGGELSHISHVSGSHHSRSVDRSVHRSRSRSAHTPVHRSRDRSPIHPSQFRPPRTSSVGACGLK